MKKLKLFALGLLSSGLVLTSCQKDEDEDVGPIISVTTTSGDVIASADAEVKVTPGAEVTFNWEARRGDSDLQDFEVSLDGTSIAVTTNGGEQLPYENISASDNSIYTDGITISAPPIQGSREYTFKITDENGLTASRAVTITTEPETTDLAAAEDFTWTRVGGTAAVGLAQFGLKWESNSQTSAIVTKDDATKMVNLGSAAWTSISTVEGLDAAIVAAAELAQYTGVSVTQDGTYDDVLGVRKSDGTIYMLHVTSGDVQTSGAGTTVTIDGQYRTE